jgi:signal peptidase I
VTAAGYTGLAGGAVAALALAYAALRRALIVVTVRGTSMEPTYQDGDRVLVRRGRAPSPGQVIVMLHPRGSAPAARTRWIIKRVAAVPGDLVPRDTVDALAEVPEDRVPPGNLVLLGDNPRTSIDSRQAGYFPAEWMVGAALRRVAGRMS